MSARQQSNSPRPHLYLFIFLGWVGSLIYFHPRLWRLLDLAHSPFSWGAILFFIVFTELAWLYGFYNLGVVIFARIYLARRRQDESVALTGPPPHPACVPQLCFPFLRDLRSQKVCFRAAHFAFSTNLENLRRDSYHHSLRCRLIFAENPRCVPHCLAAALHACMQQSLLSPFASGAQPENSRDGCREKDVEAS